MEISNVVSNQYAFFIPVALVIICAVLVFAFGFKSSVEPPNFKQLSLLSDVKKTVKKRKVKDKKSQSNGHATVVIEDSKTLKQVNKIESKPKEKKAEAKSPAKSEKKKEVKSGKENQLILNNKKNETKYEEKIDHDDGEWEIAYTKKDKKSRKKDEGEMLISQTPEKTPQKNKRAERAVKVEEAAIEILKKKAEESQKVPEEPVKVEEEPKDKKINKKVKQEKEEENVVEVVEEEKSPELPEPQELPAEEVKETVVVESEKKAEEEPATGAAFDELGDVWKEAPQKKSKKKVRKD